MILQCKTGSSRLTLKVDGYEFPDEPLGPTEDNPPDEFETARWLIVTFGFCFESQIWSVTGPYAKTSEIELLADWFDSIAIGDPSADGIRFIERDIEFTFNQRVSSLTVHLFRDFLPPLNRTCESFDMEFSLVEIELAGASNELRTILKRFPERPAI